MRRKWIRNIIGSLSFTTALFVFQACYGTLQDFELDCLIEGQVKSKSTNLPIEGILVYVDEFGQYEMTSDSGLFSFYTLYADTLTIKFEDPDSLQNGFYFDTDTLLTNPGDEVYLNIFMESR